MTTPNWVYPAEITRIVDADTLDVDVDLGFRMVARMPLRIAHIDAPERYTPAGKYAIDWLTQWLGTLPRYVLVHTYKPTDKYGRYLADVFVDELNLAQLLIETGHAVEKNYD